MRTLWHSQNDFALRMNGLILAGLAAVLLPGCGGDGDSGEGDGGSKPATGGEQGSPGEEESVEAAEQQTGGPRTWTLVGGRNVTRSAAVAAEPGLAPESGEDFTLPAPTSRMSISSTALAAVPRSRSSA